MFGLNQIPEPDWIDEIEIPGDSEQKYNRQLKPKELTVNIKIDKSDLARVVTEMRGRQPEPEHKVCPTLCYKCGKMYLTREGAIGCECE